MAQGREFMVPNISDVKAAPFNVITALPTQWKALEIHDEIVLASKYLQLSGDHYYLCCEPCLHI